mmetsp:Transcript_62232/g.166984  ORF Transcript_62232/g.166984 Transcript_62232/m.166984 type:complete len:160 (+) Transcript_62232:46-525(+)|eukprot:CAMPEP_0113701870 /NCGR_PEP_ID=MMETSP0038_2-20120614/24836_1 /TAXON_ID=2898 /ORGANISM="Cryptomonas paramecium" /LENGTH=159 /DNA_ID=CAMNT_0000625853 /DNA_START=16 /DNA_END=495 /DNA_ORIENTATION=- /assembly_acc=CAM_ASM_000170
MSVTFEDAKKTLHSMFPAIDDETIGDILKQQNGHMESAVEILLNFCGEGSAAPAQPPREQPRQAAPSRQSPPVRPRAAPAATADDEAFPAPSADFLTIGRYTSGGRSGGGYSQMAEDEALARQLQDDWFLQELRSNPELRSEFQGILQGEQGVGYIHID